MKGYTLVVEVSDWDSVLLQISCALTNERNTLMVNRGSSIPGSVLHTRATRATGLSSLPSSGVSQKNTYT